MEPRHAKMLLIFAMIILATIASGCYIFVIAHYGHVWSLILIAICHFVAIVAPSICYGYENEQEMIMHNSGSLTEESFKNLRDLGYLVAVMAMLLSFIFPIVAWYSGSIPLGAVLVIFTGNTCFIWAFQCWLKSFII